MLLKLERVERAFLVFEPRAHVTDVNDDIRYDVKQVSIELEVAKQPQDARRCRTLSKRGDVVFLRLSGAVEQCAVRLMESRY